MCNWPWTVNPCRQAHSFIFFWKWGICGDTLSPQPRFQAVGLAWHVVKQSCTQTCITGFMILVKWKSNLERNLGDTCPRTLVRWHTRVERKGEGDERERVGGKRKTRPPKRRKQVTTSKGCKLTWALFKDNACHLCSYVTLQAGARKGTWLTFTQHGSCFCKHKNSLRPQANNSLSCSWNNSYCAFGPTLAAM